MWVANKSRGKRKSKGPYFNLKHLLYILIFESKFLLAFANRVENLYSSPRKLLYCKIKEHEDEVNQYITIFTQNNLGISS